MIYYNADTQIIQKCQEMDVQASIRVDEYVWVQLTKKGDERLRRYQSMQSTTLIETFVRSVTDRLSSETLGWTRFKARELMRIFGLEMADGGQQMFVGDVISLTEPPVS